MVDIENSPAHDSQLHLARVVLACRSPEELQHFYVERLGMTAAREGSAVILGYGGEDASIELRPVGAGRVYQHHSLDRYWKIGITLPNVDIAHTQLSKAGVEVSAPRQFQDIGYMCHLQDPEGFVIELLQHDFQGQRPDGAGDAGLPLGGGARIGQITLRTADIDAALGFYRDRLGMTLLSIQPVRNFGFDLYFLTFTDERPPCADLEAVPNREWLWKRPYTTLELQHLLQPAGNIALPDDGDPGFSGLIIIGTGEAENSLQDEAGGRVQLLR